MRTHAAFGLPLEMLDIILVEDSKPMQTILRSILASLNVGRIRTFESADAAMQAMLAEPPNLVITDYRMSPMNGYQLLRSIRNRNMAPLCYVPVIMVTAHSTRTVVEKSYRGGAHAVLVKPISPAALQKRLEWVVRDARPFAYDETGHCVVEGVDEALNGHQVRFEALKQARKYHQQMTNKVTEKQDAVDKIFAAESPATEQPGPEEAPKRLGGFARVRGDGRLGAVKRSAS